MTLLQAFAIAGYVILSLVYVRLGSILHELREINGKKV